MAQNSFSDDVWELHKSYSYQFRGQSPFSKTVVVTQPLGLWAPGHGFLARLQWLEFIFSCGKSLKSKQKEVGYPHICATIAPVSYCSSKGFKLCKAVDDIFLLLTCIAPSGPLKARQQGRCFLDRSACFLHVSITNMCGVISNNHQEKRTFKWFSQSSRWVVLQCPNAVTL